MLRRPFAVPLIAFAIAACSKTADAPSGPATAPSGPVAPTPPPAGKTWSDVVSATPEGGMRMGNPDAPIKLVEYASFTCPHCKHFEEDAADALQQKYISTGKVSWEFRAMVIHGGPDFAIMLLMNCRGPEPYFQLARQLYATQEQWFGEAAIAKLNGEMSRLQGAAPIDQFKAMLESMGLYGFFAARGLPRSQADACLADRKAIDAMTATQERYTTKDNISSTPTMVINGTAWDPPSLTDPVWSQLEPVLARMTR